MTLVIWLVAFLSFFVGVVTGGWFIAGDAVPKDAYRGALRSIVEQKEIAQELRRQLVDITAKYHQLRMIGAEPVEPPPPPEPPRATDRLTDEIHARYGHSDTLLSAALQQLAADRASKRSDDDILRDIIEGVAVGDGTPI